MAPFSDPLNQQIVVGGIQGFSDLATASNTTALRATGRVSLYTHVQSVVGLAQNPATASQVDQIAEVFSGTGPGTSEIDLSASNVYSYFNNIFNGVLGPSGLVPNEANVNLGNWNSSTNVSDFKAFVDAGRAETTIQNYAPIFSPNASGATIGSFSDSTYDSLRTEALYGGGISLDTPPNYFLTSSQAAAYDSFTADEIRWGLENGLRVSVIVSPNSDGVNFVSDTAKFVAQLTALNAIPTQWIVENYDTAAPAGYVSSLGSETTLGSIDSVALWLAKNAPITTYTLNTGGSWTGNVTKSVSGQTISTEDTSGKVTRDYAANLGTIGSGSQSLILTLNEDEWAGNAQFLVKVGGKQIGGVQTATAQRVYDQHQTLTVLGSFGSQPQTVEIDFLNDGWGGSSTLDRNLYISGATLDGQLMAGSSTSLLVDGSNTFIAAVSGDAIVNGVPTIGTGPDILALSISEDYALGADAQFTVSIDGMQVGGVQTATASHAKGQDTTLDVQGDFSGSPHKVAITFLNDAWTGVGNDRNLYVDSATLNGQVVSSNPISLMSTGTQSFSAAVSGDAIINGIPTIGTGPDTLALSLSEDYALGADAQFTVIVDGVQVGGVQTATASHAAGQDTILDIKGDFSGNLHKVAINFLNDASSSAAGSDRNLYLDGASLNGQVVSGTSLSLMSSGVQSFSTADSGDTMIAGVPVIGAGPDTLALSVSQDNLPGAGAQFTVSVDGVQVGGVQTATASHAAGQDTLLDVKGDFSQTPHKVSINFINDGSSPSTGVDRNLYVDSATMNGLSVAGSTKAFFSNGSQNFSTQSFQQPTFIGGGGSDTVRLFVSEDYALNANAQFTVSVNGAQVGGVQTAMASHGAGQSQAFDLLTKLGAGTNTISVDFLNDGWSSGAGNDRNLYVSGISLDGVAESNSSVPLLSGGTHNFVFGAHSA
jgi:hypothetical protein